ncbi:TPA: hypothetical protein DCZ15_01960 [Candidatus Falkowbacteria bacterium]|nr:MAG: hypothetical protein UV95_C0001G0215 [Candidatus Falkowbacteria bacterium GW2011_GWF2_43_32]HBA36619.1 hypothetical protein [Candidatus Falkowbacteria bacterium]
MSGFSFGRMFRRKINEPVDWLSAWRPYFLILALGFLLYSQTLFFDFTYFDDSILILEKTEILRDVRNIGQLFTTDAFFSVHKFYYRPLLNLSFMLDFQLGGTLPFFFHLSNILWHCLAVGLLFNFLRLLTGKRRLSFFLSLIFLVHPVLTQAVAWIPGRNDSLLTIFILAAFNVFLAFLQRPRLRSYLGYLFFFFCALLTKENAIVLPVLIIFYFLFIDRGRLNKTDRWLIVAGSGTVALIWFLMRNFSLGGEPIDYLSAFTGFVHNLPAILVGVGKLILPANLSVLPNLFDSTLLYGLIISPLLVLAYFASRQRRGRYAIFGLAWFFMFLLPSFIRLNDLPDFLEHRLYLSLVGFLIVLLEFDWIKNLNFKKPTSKIIGLIVLAVFAGLTFWHSGNFKNRLVFWERAVADAPHSPLAHRNLGVMYYFENDLERAEEQYRQALELNPSERMAHNNLGIIYLGKEDFVRAEEEFLAELQNNPGYDKALFNLGDLYYNQNRSIEAARFWRAGLQISHGNAEIAQRLFLLENR